MEDAQRTHLLDLKEWKEWALLEIGLTECASEVSPVFEEVDDTSVHIDQHSDNGADHELLSPDSLLKLLERCGLELVELLF